MGLFFATILLLPLRLLLWSLLMPFTAIREQIGGQILYPLTTISQAAGFWRWFHLQGLVSAAEGRQQALEFSHREAGGAQKVFRFCFQFVVEVIGTGIVYL